MSGLDRIESDGRNSTRRNSGTRTRAVATDGAWASGRIVLNGEQVPDEPFQDDVWVPWFGRTASSAMVSLREVHTLGSKVRRMR